MSFLLDTCVISELVKTKPNSNVTKWVKSCDEESLFLSTLTIGEIQKGIYKLPDSRKKKALQTWLTDDLIKRFDHRILSIDLKVALKWGEIQALAEKSGNKLPTIDGLIASMGIVYDLTIITRNTQDMKPSGVKVYNPWN